MVSLCKFWIRNDLYCKYACKDFEMMRKSCKKCRQKSCGFCWLPFVVISIGIILSIAWGSTWSRGSTSTSTLSGFLSGIGFAKNPTLDPLHANSFRNDAYTMCKNPLGYVCLSNVPSIPRVVQKFNDELMTRIELEEVQDSNFGKRCVEFHRMPTGVQMNHVISHPKFTELITIIDSIKDVNGLWQAFGLLQKRGIREP